MSIDPAQQTFRALGASRLAALCRASDFPVEPAIAGMNALIGPWGDRSVGAAPRWPSDLSDDGAPIELSLAIEGTRAEPRLLVESQGSSGALADAWRAAQATNERLRALPGVSLDRLARVEALFEPNSADARFAMWHALWLRRGGAPLFKVYLDPAAHGPAAAEVLVQEALDRLGFVKAWHCVARQLRGRVADAPVYFSLDLAEDAQARVKIYLAHPGADAAEVDARMSLWPGHTRGDAVAFCRATTGRTGPFDRRPLLTTLSFTAGDDALPSATTLHVPVRCYVDDDAVAADNIAGALGPAAGAVYRRALAAIAARPLDAGVGLQTYASQQRRGDALRTTVYLATEAYAVEPARRRDERRVA